MRLGAVTGVPQATHSNRPKNRGAYDNPGIPLGTSLNINELAAEMQIAPCRGKEKPYQGEKGRESENSQE
jgi:hypothetical protein